MRVALGYYHASWILSVTTLITSNLALTQRRESRVYYVSHIHTHSTKKNSMQLLDIYAC